MPSRFSVRSISSLLLLLLLVGILASAQSISTLTPNSGPVGTSVTIAGSGFGGSQGSSTVAFNGTNATPTGWNDGQIVAPVPNGATSGNVVITVNGTASNGVFFTVTTVAPSLVSVSVTPGGASVAAGNSQPFDAVGTYSDNSTQDVTSTAIWTSSDATVAAVDANGNANGFNDGTVTIQASLGSISGSASLTVTPGQLNAIITPAYTPSSSAEAFPNQKAIAVGTDGFSRFVTGDSSGNAQRDEVVYVHCLDQDCTTSNTATFQTGAYTYEYAMAVGPDGFARVVYSSFGTAPDGFNAALGFIQCSDADCANYTQTIVDGASDNAVSSVAVDSNGNANIIYDDGNDSCRVPGDPNREDSQGIGLAICNGTSCTTRQMTTIDCHSGLMGAITVDSNNNPQMLYNDSGSQNQGTSDSVHYYAGADRVISTDGSSCCTLDLAMALTVSVGSPFPETQMAEWISSNVPTCHATPIRLAACPLRRVLQAASR